MERANKDIEEANPKKAELDKFNDDQKKILGEKQKIKNSVYICFHLWFNSGG